MFTLLTLILVIITLVQVVKARRDIQEIDIPDPKQFRKK